MNGTEMYFGLYASAVSRIGNIKLAKLLKIFGGPEGLYRAGEKELISTKLLDEKDIYVILGMRAYDYQNEYNKLSDKGIYFISRHDKEFPERLKCINDVPEYLFYRGRLPADGNPYIAIIGSRNCSSYGREISTALAAEFARCGIGIISGMASGIDGHAQRAALGAGGESYGVLGCGADICYPKTNYDLFCELPYRGGIISEYYPGTQPHAMLFPQRNRIIAGLADCVVVIEARKRSGTLITVGHALEQGKEVYAVPGRINDELSSSCNDLIKQGAATLTTPYDVISELQKIYPGIKGRGAGDNKKNINLLASREKIVYACLSLHPKHLDELADETGMRLSELSGILVSLEIRGMITEIMKNQYIKCYEAGE